MYSIQYIESMFYFIGGGGGCHIILISTFRLYINVKKKYYVVNPFVFVHLHTKNHFMNNIGCGENIITDIDIVSKILIA